MKEAVTGFFDRLAQRVGAKRRVDVETFNGLVINVADGKADPDRTAETLDRLGRTPDELKAAVELLQKRRQWRREMDALPSLQAEAEQLAAKLQAAEATYRAAVTKAESDLLTVRQSAEARQAELAKLIRQGEQARGELLRTMTNDAAAAKVREVRERAAEVRAEANKIPTARVQLPYRPEGPNPQLTGFAADDLKGRIEVRDAADRDALAANRQQYAKLVAEAESLEQEADKIEDAAARQVA